jgi:hypothetical protein
MKARLLGPDSFSLNGLFRLPLFLSLSPFFFSLDNCFEHGLLFAPRTGGGGNLAAAKL